MRTIIFSLSLITSLSVCASAIEGTENSAISDRQLLDAAAGSEYVFYKNSTEWLRFTPNGGGHAGWIRVRFNKIAAAALDAEGKLPVGTEFPIGSVVVKEIKDSLSETQAGQAIMAKAPNATNANRTWVWGEYRANGTAIASAAGAGRGCVRCHGATAETSPVSGDQGNRDLVRTFGLRP